MQQLILGLVLFIGGIVLNAICGRLRQGAAGTVPRDILEVREASARVREGQTAECTVRARLCADKPAKPPFGDNRAAYYETKVIALEGERKHVVFSESSAQRPYLQDTSGGEKLWVDMRALGNDAELMPSRMDIAQPDSPLPQEVSRRVAYEPGPSFTGYQVLEGWIPNETPVTLHGAITRQNGRLLAGPARHGTRFTYRTPEAADNRQQQNLRARIPLLIGAVAIIAGAVLVLVHFFA